MHILDFLMYIVLSVLYWIICPEKYKYEMGALAVLFVFIIFTIIYAIVFIFFLNWIDIFHHIQNVTFPSITW
jgi:hypothetical protein